MHYYVFTLTLDIVQGNDGHVISVISPFAQWISVLAPLEAAEGRAVNQFVVVFIQCKTTTCSSETILQIAPLTLGMLCNMKMRAFNFFFLTKYLFIVKSVYIEPPVTYQGHTVFPNVLL